MAQAHGSEWFAAEVVLAAEERWGTFALGDFAEMVITRRQFHDRLAERKADFFSPGYDGSAQGLRTARGRQVELLLSSRAEPKMLERLLRSLGAEIRPDGNVDAYLSRDSAQLWVCL